MNDDFLLNDSENPSSLNSLDSLFNNLTDDINNFNKYIDEVNKKKKDNAIEQQELMEEKLKVDKAKLEFENYVKVKNEEYEVKMKQVDSYLETQKQNLLKSESEFKTNMDNSLRELELSKKELDIQKEKFNEEKQQFESYENLALKPIKHAQEIIDSDKKQFEKYKEVNNKKIELENKNLEQKCDRFKELINQFNSSFKPILEEE